MGPLPQRYITGEPGVGGRIKVRPEDFLVDELPRYDPCGEGEHLYLGIQKSRVSHSELISTLRRHFNVRESAVGFAGMKDKMGITRQTISIHLPGREPDGLELSHDRITILWAMRHLNKLRRGHLAGNRFSIRIREIDALQAPNVARIVERLVKTGVPGFFGYQRFGYRRNNHRIGLLVLRRQWQEIMDELLGATGSPFPEYQRERRELYDAGNFEAAAELWTPADRVELSAIKALRSGRSVAAACDSIRRTIFPFWVSAFQSAVFNRVVDQRLEAGSTGTLDEGDVAWKHGNRAAFLVTADDVASPDLARRLREFEISPTGPLWGRSMLRAAGHVNEMERAALVEAGIDEEELMAARQTPEGVRRPLRTPVANAEVDSGLDEHGHYVRIAFDLPQGAYATVVLREIMKNDATWGEERDSAAAGQTGTP